MRRGRLEVDDDAAQRHIADVLHDMNDSGIEADPLGNGLDLNLGAVVGPLLELRAVKLDHYALAMAVPSARFSRRKPFLEDEDVRAVIARDILLGSDDLRRRLHRRMVALDRDFEKRAASRRLIFFAGAEHGDVSV